MRSLRTALLAGAMSLTAAVAMAQTPNPTVGQRWDTFTGVCDTDTMFSFYSTATHDGKGMAAPIGAAQGSHIHGVMAIFHSDPTKAVHGVIQMWAGLSGILNLAGGPGMTFPTGGGYVVAGAGQGQTSTALIDNAVSSPPVLSSTSMAGLQVQCPTEDGIFTVQLITDWGS